MHNKVPELALQNSKNVVVRFCCFCFPYRNKRKCPKIGKSGDLSTQHTSKQLIGKPPLFRIWNRKGTCTLYVMDAVLFVNTNTAQYCYHHRDVDVWKAFSLDCLIFEMRFIKELKPILNKQCDSIRSSYLFWSVLISLITTSLFCFLFCFFFQFINILSLIVDIFYRILLFMAFYLLNYF